MSNDVYLPAATGSGADYTISNDKAANITVVADHFDASGLVNGASSRVLVGKESITVVDYATHNWGIQ
jgi:hypothetical protein